MNKHLVVLFFIFVSILYLTRGAQLRNILWNEFKAKNSSINNSLNDINHWRNKLKQQIEQSLNKIPDNIRKVIIERADNETKQSWPSLVVSQYLEFVRNGNRYNFEGSRTNRRKKLVNLVIGELLTGTGKYMNEISNGLWLILEESTWMLPAHLYMQKSGVGLPDPTEFEIDLGAGETSALISWIKFIMVEKLAKVSPMIPKRIDYELNRRVIRPFLDNSHMWWMGFDGNKVNNWNAWINTNVLTTALLTVDNITLRNEVIIKTIQSADKFLNGYPNDGGCDEGPTYWEVAGGLLIEFIELLTSSTDKHLDWSSNVLIYSIGSYIYKMHIDHNKFVNFADAFAFYTPDPTRILKYGTIFNDEKLKQFASYLYQSLPNDKILLDSAESGNLRTFFNEIVSGEILKTITPKAPFLAESWLPDLQIVTLRSQQGSANGLFLGAKAGNNDESHNHNDVGNFVLYVNGFPAIIDVGVGTYTAQTFSKDRYKLWNMQSQWHNTPTINGVQQHEGPTYVSHNVSYTKLTNGGEFEADIAGAYPKEADVKSWFRKLTLDRTTNTVNLKEMYELNKFVEPFKVHFITVLNQTESNGQITLKDENISLIMEYDSKLFDVKVDKPVNNDSRILNAWGDRISRITLVSKSKDTLKGVYNIIFKLK